MGTHSEVCCTDLEQARAGFPEESEGKGKSSVMMVMIMTIIMMTIQSCEEVEKGHREEKLSR